jgi:membrane associated rhomboid family serine protease
MFLHGSWGHLIGNLLFLWVFGNNIEDRTGRFRFVVFYLATGLCAAGAQVLANPAAPIPMVGASGAVSGVMGAYLILYPRVRVDMLFIIFFFFRVVPLPAWVVLIWWFALQVLTGLPQLTSVDTAAQSGVAVFAHVGGFIVGVGLIFLLRDRRWVAPAPASRPRRR